ncbi:MAG: FMN-binding negative transcriptional regulator [Proteobacteria bacterium]|nr:FMN-binding negative transcriptional regulator [Pseudomonadota bacterium]
MYLPGHFTQTDIAALHGLMRDHPLAHVVVAGPEGLDANYLPLLPDPGAGPYGLLRGHVARTNPLWQLAESGCDCLAIFQGPHHYISPGWYPGKTEHGRVVPTWNYVVVHAHGQLRAMDDEAWLRRLLADLTAVHEAARPTPWAMEDAPADYLDRMVRAVVGIEIQITRLEGKWKLSQNRTPDDRAGVVRGLKAEGGAEGATLAQWMRDI